ncbi:MAG TPA: hypothetical protein VKU02_06340 [Gemmataceae bacterium]|nr:hypothetical protein [Gemmataceae bacterium]
MRSQEKVGTFQAGRIRTGNNKLLVLDDSGLLRLPLANGLPDVRDSKAIPCWQLNE